MRVWCAILFAVALVLFGCAAEERGEKAGGDLVASGKNSFSYGEVDISRFGHASFMLEHKGKTIYIDPFVLPSNPKPADIILYTHGHYDHCVPAKEIRKEDTLTIGNGCANAARDMEAGESISLGGNVSVEAVAAYNLKLPVHPKGSGVGYIVTFGKTRVYHAGDTDFIPEMRTYGVDVALLPIGGSVTMDESEAADAAVAIKAKIVVPMHYGTVSGTEANPQEFKKLVESRSNRTIKVVVLG